MDGTGKDNIIIPPVRGGNSRRNHGQLSAHCSILSAGPICNLDISLFSRTAAI